MKILICSALLLVTINFISCKQESNTEFGDNYDTMRTLMWYYEDGAIKKIKLFKNDSIGTNIFYYPNGQIKKVQDFKNDTIENGMYKYFYPNGQLADSGIYINNKAQGERIEYYEDGKVKAKAIFITGKLRSAWQYRSQGTLRIYNAYNFTGDVGLVIKYDSLGNFSLYRGHPITSVFVKEKVLLNERFSVEILVAYPPDSDVDLMISQKIEGGNEIRKTILKPDKFLKVKYSEVHNSRQDFYLYHIASIRDTIRNFTITDTLCLKVSKTGLITEVKSCRW